MEQFKTAIVYGKSVKHQPQRVGLAHELEDEDVGKYCLLLSLLEAGHVLYCDMAEAWRACRGDDLRGLNVGHLGTSLLSVTGFRSWLGLVLVLFALAY